MMRTIVFLHWTCCIFQDRSWCSFSLSFRAEMAECVTGHMEVVSHLGAWVTLEDHLVDMARIVQAVVHTVVRGEAVALGGHSGQWTVDSGQWTKKALAEGQSPPQVLEVGPRSRPYLLVFMKCYEIVAFLRCLSYHN